MMDTVSAQKMLVINTLNNAILESKGGTIRTWTLLNNAIYKSPCILLTMEKFLADKSKRRVSY